MKYLRLILLLSILLSGCRKTYMISPEQKIMFQVDITACETEFQHYGYYIDSKGNILSYSNPVNWNYCDRNSIVTTEQVEENLRMCTSSGKVLQSELIKFSSYIDNIASSRVTSLSGGDEKFSVKYTCFRYSGVDHSYKSYTIKTEGDYSAENLNFYTKKMVTWLKEIDMNLAIRN
ncbi:MAG TPA: hypothetical protein VK213_01075 [Bacteroidales bacterium]|nr:hypothetical protein [Bacteroidales bacterium]